MARLRHPSIVEIYDFSGDEARESYIVTEFVRGRTLKVFGDEVGFRLPEVAVLVAAQLAEALAHAHGQGIVHRDLKPENVMVRDDGALKLMDFGIARVMDGDERMGTQLVQQKIKPPFLKIVQKQSGDELHAEFGIGSAILVPDRTLVLAPDAEAVRIVPLFFFIEYLKFSPLALKGVEPMIAERSLDPASHVAKRATTKCVHSRTRFSRQVISSASAETLNAAAAIHSARYNAK